MSAFNELSAATKVMYLMGAKAYLKDFEGRELEAIIQMVDAEYLDMSDKVDNILSRKQGFSLNAWQMGLVSTCNCDCFTSTVRELCTKLNVVYDEEALYASEFMRLKSK